MASKPYLKPMMFRSTTIRQPDAKLSISKDGGEFDAGYIKNFAVITQGEALGHGAWIDGTFIEQVSQQLGDANAGIKARFTHPNQCGDSLSKGLGRVFLTHATDGKVYGDLHFWKAAHKSPDGDLAGYLLDMAQDDPSAVGASISFMQDMEAMEQFAAENPTSPDSRNVNNYPHVRLGKLRFVDIVDEPAANPDGLYHRDDTAAQATELLEYGLGLSDIKPEHMLFGVEPDRLLGFVSTFLSQKGLQIVELNTDECPEVEVIEAVETVEAPEVTEVVTEEVEAVETEVVETEEVEAPEVDEVEDIVDGGCPQATSPNFSKEELGQYIENFGKEAGLDFFMEGLDFAAAQTAHIVSLNAQIEAQKAQIELNEETEAQPLTGNNGEAVEVKGTGFKVTIK